MDILSDVKIVGNLEFGKMSPEIKSIVSNLKIGINKYSSILFDLYNIKMDGFSIFNNIPYFEKFDRKGVRGRIELLPNTAYINVPADCTKFHIFNATVDTESEITDAEIPNYYLYPLVTAFSCGKKVEMDIELESSPISCSYSKNQFTEFIIGKINQSSSERLLSVVYHLSPTIAS